MPAGGHGASCMGSLSLAEVFPCSQLHAEDFKDFRWPPCRRLSGSLPRESLSWRAKVFKVFGMEPAAWEVFKVFRWRKSLKSSHAARGSLFSPPSLSRLHARRRAWSRSGKDFPCPFASRRQGELDSFFLRHYFLRHLQNLRGCCLISFSILIGN
jgi:hypothetical protein